VATFLIHELPAEGDNYLAGQVITCLSGLQKLENSEVSHITTFYASPILFTHSRPVFLCRVL